MSRLLRTSVVRKVLAGILLVCGCGTIGYAKNAKQRNWRPKSLEELKNSKGFAWTTKSSPHFDLFVDSGTLAEREIGELERGMEDSLPGLEKLLGGPLKARLQASVVSSEPKMDQLIGGLTTGSAWGTIITMVHRQDLRDMAPTRLVTTWRDCCGARAMQCWLTKAWRFIARPTGEAYRCTSLRNGYWTVAK